MQLQNHFLIAMPHLKDEYFHHSVVYICEHNDQGSMGLVITQPTDLGIAELCAKMNFLIAEERQYPNAWVLAGGPVNLERGFILHTATPTNFEHSFKINDNLVLTTSADILQSIGTEQQPKKYLVALGCASWSANQLEGEIANNDWLVVPANERILFDTHYEDRWLEAQMLLGIEQGNFANQAGHC